MDSFKKRVMDLQSELKAPKGQTNKFGGYKYRSCEDILEAVKPLLKKYSLVLTIGDDLINYGDRYYICATATLRDTDGTEEIKNSAYAREAAEKKGMDEAQITGTASSYARKYALNGLFCIDDTKDADTDEYMERTRKKDTPIQYFCEECGTPILDHFDGHDTIPAAAIAKRGKERYGRILCIKCGKAELKRETEAEKRAAKNV